MKYKLYFYDSRASRVCHSSI